MESKKLTRLISYKLLKQVYGNRPHPDFKNYSIELIRKAVKCFYHWDESKWILHEVAD